jgi:hypothetical protein
LTAATLLSEMTTAIEDAFWNAFRIMDEGVLLFEHMAQHAKDFGEPDDARVYEQKAKEAQIRANAIREVVFKQG